SAPSTLQPAGKQQPRVAAKGLADIVFGYVRVLPELGGARRMPHPLRTFFYRGNDLFLGHGPLRSSLQMKKATGQGGWLGSKSVAGSRRASFRVVFTGSWFLPLLGASC